MRTTAYETRKNGYKFSVELDFGGEPGGEYTCWICYNGKPLLNPNTNRQVTKDFGTKFNKYHFERFVDKFIKNPDYRKKVINNG